jgi:predicted Ser/Thr protein kinase
LKIVLTKPYSKDKCIDLINSFDNKGDIFWQKRNTIKIFKEGDEEWNIKSFKIPHIINKIAYKYFRKSKSRRSFEHAQILLSKGILTPKPIAYIEFSNILGLGKSFYISENLHYDFTFNELFDKNYPDRENILNQFTEFTFQLHEKGIHHFDHSRGNTLIVEKDNKQYDFYLIDLNRMVFEEMDFEMRIKNFDRLSLTSDMILIISKKYASLINKDEQYIFQKMTQVCEAFATKRAQKKRIKKKIGL